MALTAKKVYAILKRQISDMEAQLNHPVRYKGTVSTSDLLPLNPAIGDMYNIESKSIYGEAGMNVAWNGVVWDTMGAPIDMSLYLTKEESETVIQRLVTEYFEKNPVKPGATTEQAQQIEQNKTDIASLKTETGSLKEEVAELNKDVSGKRYVNDWETGGMTINTKGWTYYSYPSFRVHTKQGTTLYLKKGDIVGLNDYRDLTYQLGWLLSNGTYKAKADMSSDFTIADEGNYVVLISSKSSTTPTTPNKYGMLFFIKSKSGMIDNLEKLKKDVTGINERLSNGIGIDLVTFHEHGNNILNAELLKPYVKEQNSTVSNKVSIRPNTTYTLTYVPPKFSSYIYVLQYDQKGTALENAYSGGGRLGYITFSTATNADKIAIKVMDQTGGSTLEDRILQKIMLYEGQFNADDYEPYRLCLSKSYMSPLPTNAFNNCEDGFPKSIAHRGLSAYYPGNTELSIVGAKRFGFYGVEIDIQFTSDGVPVLVHEATLDFISGGALSGSVGEHTSDEILSDGIEWGTWFNKNLTGVKMLTFENAVKLCKKLYLKMMLDIKVIRNDNDLDILKSILEKYNMLKNSIWAYGTPSVLFNKNYGVDTAFAVGSVLPETWCDTIKNQIKEAQFDKRFIVYQDVSLASVSEYEDVIAHGFDYALYNVNDVKSMNDSIEKYGYIHSIESDKFTIQEAMHRKYNVTW